MLPTVTHRQFKNLYPHVNFNAYVKLTQLTKEDIERKTGT